MWPSRKSRGLSSKWKCTGSDSVCICMLRISFDTYCGQISSKQIYQTDSRAQSRFSGTLTDPTVIHTWPERGLHFYHSWTGSYHTSIHIQSTQLELSSGSLKLWEESCTAQENTPVGFRFLEKHTQSPTLFCPVFFNWIRMNSPGWYIFKQSIN